MRCLPKILAGLTAGLVLSTIAGAQAWLPPKGEAWLTFGYGNIYSAHHYGTGENPPDPAAGVTRNQTLGLILGYGITDRLAMNVSIPFVDSIYHGTVRVAALLKRQPADALRRIRGSVGPSVERFRDGERYRVPMPAVLITGRKPTA